MLLWHGHSWWINVTRTGVIYLTELFHCTRNAAHLFRPFKKKKLCDLCLKKPKKMKTFNRLLAKSRPVLFKKLAVPLPSNYLTVPKPQQKACQHILFTTLEEKSSWCFHFIQKIRLQKEIFGSTSDVHCLVMQFFFLIMVASIMLYHSCRPSDPNWLYLLTEQT